MRRFHLENIRSDDAVFISAGGRGGTKQENRLKRKARRMSLSKRGGTGRREQEFFITREDEP
jgi:hypothetical protein